MITGFFICNLGKDKTSSQMPSQNSLCHALKIRISPKSKPSIFLFYLESKPWDKNIEYSYCWGRTVSIDTLGAANVQKVASQSHPMSILCCTWAYWPSFWRSPHHAPPDFPRIHHYVPPTDRGGSFQWKHHRRKGQCSRGLGWHICRGIQEMVRFDQGQIRRRQLS